MIESDLIRFFFSHACTNKYNVRLGELCFFFVLVHAFLHNRFQKTYSEKNRVKSPHVGRHVGSWVGKGKSVHVIMYILNPIMPRTFAVAIPHTLVYINFLICMPHTER